jgi:hypothetical protein
MLAARVHPAAVADDVAARVGAHILHPGDPAAEHLHGQRLHVIFHPQCEGGGALTGQLLETDLRSPHLGDTHRVRPPAAVWLNPVGNWRRHNVRGAQHVATQGRVVPQGGEARIEEPARRIFKRDRCERRIALRHQAEPECAKDDSKKQQGKHCAKNVPAASAHGGFLKAIALSV